MQVLTLKKPIYLGTQAQIIAAQAEAEKRGQKHAERTRAARAAVGKRFVGSAVRIARIAGARHLLVGEEAWPAGVEPEGEGVLRFAGDDGSVVVSIDSAA